MDAGMDGLGIVAARLDADADVRTGFGEVAVRVGVDEVAAVGGDDGVAAGDFATRLVGDAGFDAVPVVGLAWRDGGVKVDGELTVGIEHAFLVEDLLVAEIGVGGLVGAGLGVVRLRRRQDRTKAGSSRGCGRRRTSPWRR